ncbi:MAG: tetrathionate reductase family octaheme c-type cytochrome [Rhodocyclaceae bacterium]|nr:tetrathionate reductase family octaheme c-type cytochrome [Rhodocyclaceae bacterium]
MSSRLKLALAALAAGTLLASLTAVAMPAAAPTSAVAAASNSTADHSKFKALQQPFKTGPEVTKACLGCHTEAAKQVQHTKHWTWEFTDPKTGKKLGKRNIINNFCTSPISNEKDCMACHAGYGWKDSSFDFSVEANVDCMVCHDTTGTYRKLPGDAGHPVYQRREFPPGSGKFVEAVDLRKVAQSIGKTSRSTCGSCHFFGAGANGTKHGDLDAALQNPDKYLDVHMDRKGLNFTCATCHQTSGHQVAGSRYEMAAAVTGPAHMRGKADAEPASCQSCHGDRPHPAQLAKLNDHARKVACQTCHIPEYARDAIGTELSWDWSQATKMGADGKPVAAKDSAGRRAFDSKKGAWVWDSYVVPEYRWFNGEFAYKTLGDKIDPSATVEINHPGGSPAAADSRIWPLKIHRGKQAYDTENNILIVAHTAGEDDTALWHNYDWQKAIGTGMKAAGLPYSGKYGFVSTEMSWPITHMVAPKGDALACHQCHSENGRLQGVAGVYLPGRDRPRMLDMIGWTIVALSLGGSMMHGILCVLFRRCKRSKQA